MPSSMKNLISDNDSGFYPEIIRIAEVLANAMENLEEDIQRLEEEKEELSTARIKMVQDMDELKTQLSFIEKDLNSNSNKIDELKDKRKQLNSAFTLTQQETLAKNQNSLMILKLSLRAIGIDIADSEKKQHSNYVEHTYITDSEKSNHNGSTGGNNNV